MEEASPVPLNRHGYLMRIEFCSLCDESVPLLDLDKGVAVKTKGRVVCAKCESAMSVDGSPEKSPELALIGSEPTPQAHQPHGVHGSHQDPSRNPSRKRRRQPGPEGLLGGLLFGAFTLIVIGAVATGFHFYDQYELERAASGDELRSTLR